MNLFAMIVVMIVIQVAVYALVPKPKAPKPPAAQDLQAPTASAGKTIAKHWGTMTLKSPNVLYYGEKSVREYKIK